MWINPQELADAHANLVDVSRYIESLTQNETVKPGKAVLPGEGNTKVFTSAFPSTMMAGLPCIPASAKP